MTKSATVPRGGRRAEIITAAQQLAIDHGYSGFTFDDLAHAVGVSRRTLFNHVSSKEEAVLGVLPELTDEQMATLRAGGPTGDLVEDLLITLIDALGGDEATVEDWQQMHDVVRRNPELLVRVHDFVDELTEELVTHLTTRDGVDTEHARMTLTIIGGIVGLSVQDCLDRPTEAELRQRVQHNATLAREVLTARR